MNNETINTRVLFYETSWLPVRVWNTFYDFTFNFQLALNGVAPAYVSDLIKCKKAETLFTALQFRHYPITSSRENEKIFW